MKPFGADPLAFFSEVYRGPAPWDVGGAQTALEELFALFPPDGPALDVGCGTGDLAIALAHLGIDAVGVDFVPAAIAEAESRAASLTDEVRRRLAFRVADALRPSALQPAPWGQPFRTVVDSGFLHLFDDTTRDAFLADLAGALGAGGRYYLLGFAVTFPAPDVPLAVTEQEVRRRFSPDAGWRVLHCAPATFASRLGDVPATVACAERVRQAS
jgi:SAM-dependent methyltransferase